MYSVNLIYTISVKRVVKLNDTSAILTVVEIEITTKHQTPKCQLYAAFSGKISSVKLSNINTFIHHKVA